MAEVTCPSPFGAAGSLKANIQVECIPIINEYTVSWNPLDKSSTLTLSNGNLTVAANIDTAYSIRATEAKSSAKWYWEIYIDSKYDGHIVGVGKSIANLEALLGHDVSGWGYRNSGKTLHNNAEVSYGSAFTTGDIIGVALDMDAGKIWFAKNNVWQTSGDPVNGTNEAFSGIAGSIFPMATCRYYFESNIDKQTARFSVLDQTYSPPLGFDSFDSGALDAFTSINSLSSSGPECLWINIESPLSATGSLFAIPQPQIMGSTFSANGSLQAVPTPAILAGSFSAAAGFTCDHCFNYAQIAGTCPTPTSKIDAVFRWARIDASPPVPTAGFIVGKRIQSNLPVPDFTCVAYHGRNPSLIADAPCPTCSMRTGLSLSDVATISRKAGVPIPTCVMVATSAHVATIYGDVPCPILTCTADTENITILTASAPCPRGLFEVTVGNVADIFGRTPCPTCSIVAITGEVITLSGSVPVPGPLVRFYASPMNVNITLNGAVPVPTMISCVSGLTSLILRHIRGEVR